MAQPTTREEFADYCLRRLGYPVIDINVAPEQIDDRIDDALDRFYDYHFDGTEEDLLIVQLSDDDVTNNYITLDDKVFSVIKVYPLTNTTFGGVGIFSAQYQFYLNDFYNFSANGGVVFSGGLQYYNMMKSYLELSQTELSPVNSFHFNRKTNRIRFNETIAQIKAKASYVMFKVYKKLDIGASGPREEIWQDQFMKEYATALIKKQWGSNIKKFGSVSLPGGVTLNGEVIYTEAEAELAALEEKLLNDLTLPLEFFCG